MEVESGKIFSYVFVWHSYIDARSCPKCVALNGREYRGQDLFAPVLLDSEFGLVWDLNQDIPLTHLNCRCFLEVTVESINLESLEGFKEFWQTVETMK